MKRCGNAIVTLVFALVAVCAQMAVDAAMMANERLNFHPLVNTRTTGLASVDLVKFLRATGHQPLIASVSGGAD